MFLKQNQCTPTYIFGGFCLCFDLTVSWLKRHVSKLTTGLSAPAYFDFLNVSRNLNFDLLRFQPDLFILRITLYFIKYYLEFLRYTPNLI